MAGAGNSLRSVSTGPVISATIGASAVSGAAITGTAFTGSVAPAGALVMGDGTGTCAGFGAAAE
jgi:hypothetical protein